MEMTVWLILSPYQVDKWPWVVRAEGRLNSNATINDWGNGAHESWIKLKRRASSFLLNTEDWMISNIVRLLVLLPWISKRHVQVQTQDYLEDLARRRRNMGSQRQWEVLFFRPIG